MFLGGKLRYVLMYFLNFYLLRRYQSAITEKREKIITYNEDKIRSELGMILKGDKEVKKKGISKILPVIKK